VLTATTGLASIREHYRDENRDLLRVMLNSTSAAEANLALEVLRHSIPARPLVAAANLREVLRALPSTPFTMRVDEATLARIGGFERRIAAMGKRLDPEVEVVITTAGNLVLDIIIKHRDQKHFWNPVPITDDYVGSAVLDLIVMHDSLLDTMIETATTMGVVFNPKFYLSLDDWHLEYAEEVFEGLGDLF
jgi:hypothetical protein